MRSFKNYLILVLFFIIGCSTTQEPINHEEVLNERNGIFYTKDTNKPYSGPVFSIYGNGTIKDEGVLENGKMMSFRRIQWWSNVQKREVKNYKDGKPHGLWREWYENGQKRIEKKFKDGLSDSVWTSWYEDGSKKSIAEYLNGKQISLNEWWQDGAKKDKSKLRPGKFTTTKESSEIFWECEWLGGSSHDGSVQLVSGSIDISETLGVNGKFIVDLNSMKCFDLKNEGVNKKLIGHLKSDDFFDVVNYPNAVLELLSGKSIRGNNFIFNGNLTIKGRTHPIIFTGIVIENNSLYEADLDLIFDRSKYDVRYRSASLFSDLGDRIIADDVKLNVKAKFKRDSKD